MTTKSIVVCALLASVGIGMAAHAEIYQWKDGSGKTVISDTPPPGTAKITRSLGGNQPAVVSEKPPEGAKAPDAPKSMAEKDMDFKKRQQEAKEKAEKQAKDQAAEADKRENCERARRNLAALENNQPMATIDGDGQRKMMDAMAREQEVERARRFLAESCK